MSCFRQEKQLASASREVPCGPLFLPRHHCWHSCRVSKDSQDHVLPLDVCVILLDSYINYNIGLVHCVASETAFLSLEDESYWGLSCPDGYLWFFCDNSILVQLLTFQQMILQVLPLKPLLLSPSDANQGTNGIYWNSVATWQRHMVQSCGLMKWLGQMIA